MCKQIEEITPLLLIQNDEYWLPYALRAVEGHFGRMVIYNVGSTDATKEIIQDFQERNRKNTDLFIRHLPDCPPGVQICFRNSMIAEARSDFYLILDGDEIYGEKSVENIKDSWLTLKREYELNGKLYGVVNRIEVCDDLRSAYGSNTFVPHHRLYHRLAIWDGTHPGERPVYKQRADRELIIDEVTCYHFHNARRSRNDAQGRTRRKEQETYKRGGHSVYDVWAALPVLHKPTSFPTHPVLRKMQGAEDDLEV